MKKMGMVFAAICICGLTACQSEQKTEVLSGAYDVYEGYLTIEEDQLKIDPFVFVDQTDGYWIRELHLTEMDMPNGYYIYDPSSETEVFPLSKDTRYYFYDTAAEFVPEENLDRLYMTTDLQVFLEAFAVDEQGTLSKTPFSVKVLEGGEVLSVSEIFVN